MNKAELEKMTQRTQGYMAKAVDAVKGAQSKGEAMRKLAEAFLPEGDPMCLFMTWADENTHRLKEAVSDLGLEIPEGPGFAKRLREAVTPKLKEIYDQNH